MIAEGIYVIAHHQVLASLVHHATGISLLVMVIILYRVVFLCDGSSTVRHVSVLVRCGFGWPLNVASVCTALAYLAHVRVRWSLPVVLTNHGAILASPVRTLHSGTHHIATDICCLHHLHLGRAHIVGGVDSLMVDEMLRTVADMPET